jgi:catechol 2,3-dioxygenase-like lactoylglutathione lyase family enzyme
MNPKAGYSTPLLHVADVERSLRFYALLGFETIDVEGNAGSLGWARVHCEGGAIMFVRAEGADSANGDRFFLYLYTPDLPALRTQLSSAGVEVGSIAYPDHMRSGEMCLKDPDGYVIFVGHWGTQEHDAWEEQREKKRAAGLIPLS